MAVNWPAQCGVVIPCLNEASTIAELIEGVAHHLPTVVVVDDGSKDHTAQVAAQRGATVLNHPRRRGKGAALGTGLAWLMARRFTWALLMDGDGQHSPADIPAFLLEADRTGADLIIGNRMEVAGEMPWLRRHVNRWMSRRLSQLSGRTLPDSQCGFRLLRLEAWSKVQLSTSHFEIESELLVEFVTRQRAVHFVPIQVIYRDEQTKISPLVDAWRWCRWFLRAQSGGRNRAEGMSRSTCALTSARKLPAEKAGYRCG